MGYVNKDRRLVNVSKREKTWVKRLRRRAEQREVHGEHERTAVRARKRGWWYA